MFESISLQGLRLSHLRQLRSYIKARDEGDDSGWYYGNRKQFETRHAELLRWIESAVRYAESEGVKMPKIRRKK